jgi:NAD(P)-dependent dehydrogenase (short-subunit alcohol dehydrogenase family)
VPFACRAHPRYARLNRETIDMAQFDGRVLIVTGGARGIGEAVARGFVQRGGRVVLADIDVERGRALAAEIGHAAVFQEADVRNPTDCETAVRRAVAAFGTADCLVNSALKMAPAPLADLKPEDWRSVIEVGLTGTFLMTQAFGRWVIAHNRTGAVVNLSSMSGFQPYTSAGAYSTVKAAVLMLSDHFAIEWARKGIRVNAVAPGHIETPLTAYLKDPVIKKGRSDVTPLGRVGQVDDVVGGILFLLSDEARYVTASNLMIDGGVTKSIFNHFPGRTWD